MEYKIEPIGIIHTPYTTKEECPIQGCVQPEGKGTVEVFSEYSEGLKDIETFSHVFLVYIFDKAGEVKLVRPTFLDDSPHGVFACRHPCRPNSIGISIVKLLKREGTTLEVSGIDILDGTPLVDIKPYVPRFDYFADATDGWAAEKRIRPKPPGRE